MFSDQCPVCKYHSVYYTETMARCGHCTAYQKTLPWYQQVLTWTNGKTWWWRLLIVAWLGWIAFRYATDYGYPMMRMANIFNAIDFGIHELGHFLFIPFGEFMTILGGSLFQVMFPIAWLIALTLKRWYFAASLCFVWIGLNLYDVAAYVADARARVLPLATLASDYDSAHDWYQLLSRMGRLESDLSIAFGLRVIGAVFALFGFVLALCLIILMIVRPFRRTVQDHDEPPAHDTPASGPNKIYPDAPVSHTSKDFEK